MQRTVLTRNYFLRKVQSDTEWAATWGDGNGNKQNEINSLIDAYQANCDLSKIEDAWKRGREIGQGCHDLLERRFPHLLAKEG